MWDEKEPKSLPNTDLMKEPLVAHHQNEECGPSSNVMHFVFVPFLVV